MKYTLAIIFICFASAFSQESVVDTIYTDTHKVTYIIDTTNTVTEKANENITGQKAPKDTFGLSAPPNKLNRASLIIIAQSLSLSLNYEHLFSDFWSFAIRFGYAGFNKNDIYKKTDTQGTIYTYSLPLSLKWYWGRRNTGDYRYVNAVGTNYHKSKSQAEGFIQAQVAPILYDVDLHRDSSSRSDTFNLKEKEYTAYITAGLGFNFCYEHFIFSTEFNIGAFPKKPKFQKNITVYNSQYGTRLLENIIAESMLSIGWQF